jgi:hypothetical protein
MGRIVGHPEVTKRAGPSFLFARDSPKKMPRAFVR